MKEIKKITATCWIKIKSISKSIRKKHSSPNCKCYASKIELLSNDIHRTVLAISPNRDPRGPLHFPHLSNWALMRPMKYQTQHGTKHIPMFAVPVSHFGEKQQINRSILPSTHIHFDTNYVSEALGGCYYGWHFAKARLSNVVCGSANRCEEYSVT